MNRLNDCAGARMHIRAVGDSTLRRRTFLALARRWRCWDQSCRLRWAKVER